MDKIEKYTAGQEVSFIWEAPLHNTAITIKIPGFSSSEYSMWGDWGPMYTIKVDPKKPIAVSYKDLKNDNDEKYFLEETSFELNSPMLANEREKLPFFFKIQDRSKGFIYQLFVNKKSEVVRAEILRSEDNTKLFSGAVVFQSILKTDKN